MKIVKLGSRYVLAQYGFIYAVRFNHQCTTSDDIKQALYQIHADANPWNWYFNRDAKNAPWGYYKNPKRLGSTPFWIGVKNEADLTAAILMTSMNE